MYVGGYGHSVGLQIGTGPSARPEGEHQTDRHAEHHNKQSCRCRHHAGDRQCHFYSIMCVGLHGRFELPGCAAGPCTAAEERRRPRGTPQEACLQAALPSESVRIDTARDGLGQLYPNHLGRLAIPGFISAVYWFVCSWAALAARDSFGAAPWLFAYQFCVI